MDYHQLICALKDMAIEMGRTPSREEFQKTIRGGRRFIDSVGGYETLRLAAGLEPVQVLTKKYGNEIFKRDLPEVLSEHEPREVSERIEYTPTVIIGDTHFPFVSHRILESIYEFIEKEKPVRVIQIGDLYDMYAHSKFPRSQNIYTPDQEEDLAIDGAKKMWATIRSIIPQAECVQLLGNHDVRPVRRTLEANAPSERAVKHWLEKITTFDGVNTIHDSRQEYIFEGIMAHHGYLGQLGAHMTKNLMNFVCGHTHKGGVVFRRFRGQTFWELNAGLVGDPESKVQSYTPQKNHDCTGGLGFIDQYGPRFIPL